MIEIAVIGLSESGKTVYITSLINHLLRKDLNGILHGITLDAETDSNSESIFPTSFFEKKSEMITFPYEDHLERFLKSSSQWPQRTKKVSEYVLKILYKKRESSGLRSFKIRVLDYPGEFFADFPMLNQTYTEWSNTIMRVLRAKQNTDWEGIFMKNSQKSIDELGEIYYNEVRRLEKEGYNYIQPSKYFGLNSFDDLKKSDLFFPLPVTSDNKNDVMVQELEYRFENYKLSTVEPNYRLLQNCSYQIILFDVLTTLTMSISHYNDVAYTVEKILEQFDYTFGSSLIDLIFGLFSQRKSRIKKMLFLATKADMVKKSDRARMVKLLQKMVETSLKKIKLRASIAHNFSASVDFVSAMKCTEDIEEDSKEGLAISEGGKLERIKNVMSVPDDWPCNEEGFIRYAKNNKILNFSPRSDYQRYDVIFPDINLDEPFLKLIAEELS